MLAYTYVSKGHFELLEKEKPRLLEARDAIVKVTLASICSSDLHIKHGSVPRAVPGVTVGHEMVGVVEAVGSAVSTVRPGDRVTVNNDFDVVDCFRLIFLSKLRFLRTYLTSPPYALDSSDARQRIGSMGVPPLRFRPALSRSIIVLPPPSSPCRLLSGI